MTTLVNVVRLAVCEFKEEINERRRVDAKTEESRHSLAFRVAELRENRARTK